MKCENPCCNKEVTLSYCLDNGVYVCENCAILSGMTEEEINNIKKEGGYH